MSSFARDVKRWSKKTGLSVDKTIRGVALSLFTGIISDTRVDTGRLKGNWQTSVGSPVFFETDDTDKTPQGSISNRRKAQIASTIADGKGKTMYMSNNLPYAKVWEERDAMVARNMARVQQIVREEARKNA